VTQECLRNSTLHKLCCIHIALIVQQQGNVRCCLRLSQLYTPEPEFSGAIATTHRLFLGAHRPLQCPGVVDPEPRMLR
jgi:hypothetical protein